MATPKAVVTLPDFQSQTINYVVLFASLVPIVIGTALIWRNSDTVTVNTNAARAANYYVMAFYYIWISSVIQLMSPNHFVFSRSSSTDLFFSL